MATEYTRLGTEQNLTIDVNRSSNQQEKISIEVLGNDYVELGVETVDQYGDESFAYVGMNREQLWEHIHNCLNALEGLK